MTSENAQLTKEGHTAVVETTRILLEAGAEKDNTRMRSLFILLDDTENTLEHMTSTFVVSKYFDLIVALVRVFRKYELDNERRYTLHILLGAMAQIERYDRLTAKPVGFRGRLDLLNAAMDGFGDVFRCFDTNAAAMFCVEGYSPIIIRTFSTIAGYSSQSGHSDRLLRLILNSLGEKHVTELKEALSKRLGPDGDWSSVDLRENATRALELVSRVQLPRSLAHLACSAILRAHWDRDMSSAADLFIPEHLEKLLVF